MKEGIENEEETTICFVKVIKNKQTKQNRPRNQRKDKEIQAQKSKQADTDKKKEDKNGKNEILEIVYSQRIECNNSVSLHLKEKKKLRCKIP